MKIGNVELQSNVLLAPMAGVTDLPYRTICRECGCKMTYTEMVSAKGLHYKSERTKSLLDVEPYRPVGAQIFGKEIDVIQETVETLVKENIIDVIDINMGCPAPKIVKNGEGSALMKNPETVYELVKNAVAVSKHIPITVKIRKGWDDESVNAVEVALMAQKAGASLVTVHGRTRKQFYSGVADYEIIKQVKDALDIPVIGNGDIFKPHDALRMLEQTNVDGVMVARGIEGNPWLCQQVEDGIAGCKVQPIDLDTRFNTLFRHIDYVVDYYGEKHGMPRMRKQMAWYIKGMRNSSELRGKLHTVKSKQEGKEILLKFKESLNA